MIDFCVNAVDYSAVIATPRLPFTFTLDENSSILHPGAGQSQRFCYVIRGVGENTSAYADLSHFVLGVCPQLTLEDILSAEVTIGGVPQQVTLGQNVSIRSADQPDPTTACAGLKVDFPLSKTAGVMTLCLTLARTFAVGAVRVCVKGGQTALDSLFICGPGCAESNACSTVVSQRAMVCLPVTVSPYATVGNISLLCCGEPSITTGTAACVGDPNASCTFTISQNLCLNIPVTFGADAVTGQANALCQSPALEACACATDAFAGW